jgi:hypothetical protein
MKWAYRRYEVDRSRICSSGIVYRPVADLRIGGAHGETRVRALIDTGADHTLLPISIAERVGAELYEDQPDSARGVAGQEIPIIPGRVQLELLSDEGRRGSAKPGSHPTARGSCEWTAVVGFADFATPEEECSLLGHAGCLEIFHAAFDGIARTVELTPIADLPPA